MKKAEIKNLRERKPDPLKQDKRVVTYLNDQEYKTLNAICEDREETEAAIIREALLLYFQNKRF